MSSRLNQPLGRRTAVSLCLFITCFAVLAFATSSAHAADYKMLLCAGNNGSNSYQTATNTTSPQNPGGIFSFENYCGPAGDPAGNSALLRIDENQGGGNAGDTAYGSISWTVPPWIAIIAGGGYTREPGDFNDGWRGRFWAEGFDGSTNNILMQGSGVQNGSCGGICWATTSTFASAPVALRRLRLLPSLRLRDDLLSLRRLRSLGLQRRRRQHDPPDARRRLAGRTAPDQHRRAAARWPVGARRPDRHLQLVGGQGSGIRMEWIDIDGARALHDRPRERMRHRLVAGERRIRPPASTPAPTGGGHRPLLHLRHRLAARRRPHASGLRSGLRPVAGSRRHRRRELRSPHDPHRQHPTWQARRPRDPRRQPAPLPRPLRRHLLACRPNPGSPIAKRPLH